MTKRIRLYPHQLNSVAKLHSGSILCGMVGTGKSLTALAYYFEKECAGVLESDTTEMINMRRPKDLYIITTARKRDTLEWDKECLNFNLSRDPELNHKNINVIVDSWNNIQKYTEVKDAFFIFDEQKLVGYGAWVKSFLKITKTNNWILLSATPGDTWYDYLPVFIANGFYKNKTEFNHSHVVFNNYVKYPLIERYIDTGILEKHRRSIVVMMPFKKHTKQHHTLVQSEFDKVSSELIFKDRWNPFEQVPIKNITEMCYMLRKVTNTDPSRIKNLIDIMQKKQKTIIFYNFDYELEILRGVMSDLDRTYSEWNGHNHDPIPDTDSWSYLVQYTAGAEGWNCVDTDTIVFYSQNYSYKIMIQSAGRIDRLNTPFTDLYYYHLTSLSQIDRGIKQAISQKKKFNESIFSM